MPVPTRGERDERQADAGRGKRQRVERRDLEQQAREKAREQERAGDSDNEACAREDEALAEDAPEDAQPIGAERHADAELARPLADREREHAADADRGNRQRERGEAAEKRGVCWVRSILLPNFSLMHQRSSGW